MILQSQYIPDMYYRCPRPEILGLIKKGPNRVLDVGCGEGIVSSEIKQQGLAAEVVGIEINALIAENAKKCMDYLECGDVQQVDFSQKIYKDGFDYILCGDVLEHLSYPSEVLVKLAGILKPGGCLITSIPNVRNWRVIAALVIKGEWRYCSHGILDYSHLRFFTRKSSKEMIKSVGLDIASCEALIGRKVDRVISRVFFGTLDEFLAHQWLFCCRKSIR